MKSLRNGHPYHKSVKKSSTTESIYSHSYSIFVTDRVSRLMTFDFGAYKLRQKVLMGDNEGLVHVPDVYVLLLLVNSSRRSSLHDATAHRRYQLGGCGRILGSLEKRC